MWAIPWWIASITCICRCFLEVHNPFRDETEVHVNTLVNKSKKRTSYERWLALGTRLFDLSDLFDDIERLAPTAASSRDPDESEIDMDAEADPDEDSGLTL